MNWSVNFKQRKYQVTGEFDIIKGMAILVVIFTHTILYKYDTFDDLQAFENAYILLLKPLSIVMPIFFFIAGYFAYKSFLRKKSASAFILSRMKFILPPYLIWSTVYTIIQTVVINHMGVAGEHFTAFEIVEKYLTGDVVFEFYFLFLLIFFYILTPHLSLLDIKTLKKLSLLFFITGIIFCFIFYIPLYFGKIFIPLKVLYRNPFIWAFFYIWGIYASRNYKVIGPFWRKKPGVLLLLFFSSTYIGAILELFFLPERYKFLPGSILFAPIGYLYYVPALYIFLWLAYRISKSSQVITRFFKMFGRHTLGLYVSHGLFAGIVLLLLRLFIPNILVKSTPLINFIGFMLTSIFAIFVIRIVWRINKKLYITLF